MQIPESICHKCGYKMDATTDAYGNNTPNEGDYSMCLNCGTISIFNEDLRLRAPTKEERLLITTDQRVLQAQLVRYVIVPDGR